MCLLVFVVDGGMWIGIEVNGLVCYDLVFDCVCMLGSGSECLMFICVLVEDGVGCVWVGMLG